MMTIEFSRNHSFACRHFFCLLRPFVDRGHRASEIRQRASASDRSEVRQQSGTERRLLQGGKQDLLRPQARSCHGIAKVKI